jgi:hypothetical protein
MKYLVVALLFTMLIPTSFAENNRAPAVEKQEKVKLYVLPPEIVALVTKLCKQ